MSCCLRGCLVAVLLSRPQKKTQKLPQASRKHVDNKKFTRLFFFVLFWETVFFYADLYVNINLENNIIEL